jgi:glycosyltransferase involved in cell wall biosynthesis
MAAACAVVSFDSAAPGVRHGRTGWLVESGNVEAFADGVVTLLQDSQRAGEIGRAARDYVVETCSWPMAAERCEQLYLQLQGRMT